MLLHFATLCEKHIVRESTHSVAGRQKTCFDTHVKGSAFAVDQHVWLYWPRPLVRQKKKTRKWHKFGLVHWKLHNLSHLWVSKFNIPVQTKLKLYTLIGWHLVTFLHLRLNRKPNQNNLWNLNRNVIPLVQENLQFIWLHTSKPQRQMLFSSHKCLSTVHHSTTSYWVWSHRLDTALLSILAAGDPTLSCMSLMVWWQRDALSSTSRILDNIPGSHLPFLITSPTPTLSTSGSGAAALGRRSVLVLMPFHNVTYCSVPVRFAADDPGH